MQVKSSSISRKEERKLSLMRSKQVSRPFRPAKKIKYVPSSENERESLTMIIDAKRRIKQILRSEGHFEVSQINDFYKTIKTSNQLFYLLTNKDQESQFLKYQAQKVLYYLIEILMQNERQRGQIMGKDDILKILKMIKMIMMINPYLAIVKLSTDHFLRYLFGLLKSEQDNEKMTKVCVNIIEAILVANNFMINLEYFPSMFDFFDRCLISEFSNFMRVIALVVLELNENKTEDFFELKMSMNENIMIKNHSFLLMSTAFLKKCYKILTAITGIMETFYKSKTAGEFKAKWIILEEKKHIENSAINARYFEDYLRRDQFISSLINREESIHLVIKHTNISELLFVISNLLSSKRKIDIQAVLFSLGFVDEVLNPLYDILFDEKLVNNNNRGPFDEEDDELGESNSDTLSTIRIQFLRIVINFSDRDASNMTIKSSFITKQESQALIQKVLLPILRSYYFKFDFMDNPAESMNEAELSEVMDFISSKENDDFPFELHFSLDLFDSVKKKGLILKVCQTLMSVPRNSPYRFWLASVVESFLRGFNSLHQILVAATGMISFLLQQLIFDKSMKTNNIQITFDLLGEIIKFNKINVVILNTICQENDYQDKLLRLMEENIIDSNVFLRSLIIGFEKFEIMRRNQNQVLNFTDGLELRHIIKKQEKKWLKMLIKCLEPKALNPDNICCINTALILCIISENYKNLPDLLEDLRSNIFDDKRSLFDNFLNLLEVWQNYYMNKNKDCFGLQYSTNIHFVHFKKMKMKINNYSRSK